LGCVVQISGEIEKISEKIEEVKKVCTILLRWPLLDMGYELWVCELKLELRKNKKKHGQ
jgi:hypothetical protein